MSFRVEKDRMKFKGYLNSHSSQNPIKRRDMNLKIIGRMVLDIIRILEHNPCENKLIIMIKNHQPHRVKRVNKGEPVRRILMGK